MTATPGLVQELESAAQPVNVIDEAEIAERAFEVVSQVANEEAGLALQRTSQVMSGIFVRGLTGNKVNIYVDGVRYTHAGQRGGVNTFLNLNDPSFFQGVEVLRGPSSSQCGSDALGGSIQLLTRTPVVGGSGVSGQFSVAAGSADQSVSSSLHAVWSSEKVGANLTLTRRTSAICARAAGSTPTVPTPVSSAFPLIWPSTNGCPTRDSIRPART